MKTLYRCLWDLLRILKDENKTRPTPETKMVLVEAGSVIKSDTYLQETLNSRAGNVLSGRALALNVRSWVWSPVLYGPSRTPGSNLGVWFGISPEHCQCGTLPQISVAINCSGHKWKHPRGRNLRRMPRRHCIYAESEQEGSLGARKMNFRVCLSFLFLSNI